MKIKFTVSKWSKELLRDDIPKKGMVFLHLRLLVDLYNTEERRLRSPAALFSTEETLENSPPLSVSAKGIMSRKQSPCQSKPLRPAIFSDTKGRLAVKEQAEIRSCRESCQDDLPPTRPITVSISVQWVILFSMKARKSS